MFASRLIGLGAMALGIGLLVFAWRGSHAPIDRVTNALRGHYSRETMWSLMAGVVATTVGAGALYFGKRRH